MKIRFITAMLVGCTMLTATSIAQNTTAKDKWVDSVFNSLNNDQRIAQLMVIRTSTSGKNGTGVFFDKQTDELVEKYNVGAVCLFQGTPQQQAALLNRIQAKAKTPIMVTVDGEWGLGMRFAGVENFPYQLTMGAMADAQIVYEVGAAIAEQCKRLNIHVNYAPVVDINNNPANPVIGVRSFGEDKYKVGLMGTRIMEGMQDNGVMACAKHFPGHGDVNVDSHYDLPVINKSMEELADLELYPFEQVFSKGIGSVMVAHLYIPAIDNTANRATSLSPNNINGLLRKELGYNGLTFTDALEMKGVAKFYPKGAAAVQSIVAGNDMLCLPGDVPLAITEIKEAIANKTLSWEDIYTKTKRVLAAKYDYVRLYTNKIDSTNLTEDLNARIVELRTKVAEQAFTVLKQSTDFFPKSNYRSWTYLMVSKAVDNNIALQVDALGGQVQHLPISGAMTSSQVAQLVELLKKSSQVVVGVHNLNRSPGNNFGMDKSVVNLLNEVGEKVTDAGVIIYGNPYALGTFNAETFETIAVAYEDDDVFRNISMNWLKGDLKAKGTLPVTVGNFKYGTGLLASNHLPLTTPNYVGLDGDKLDGIDAIAKEGIAAKAFPGCVVTVVRHGKVAFQKAYGNYTYDAAMPMRTDAIFDLASVTKISATTIAVMRLYDQGALDIKEKISTYLPWLKKTNKENLTVENLLLHQAGMVSWIPFYKDIIDKNGAPDKKLFSNIKGGPYSVDVTERLYMDSNYVHTMYDIIKNSAVKENELNYIYSDNDFILLAKIVESISGLPIDAYVQQEFYQPMGMQHTGYKPYERFPLDRIVPTEDEQAFRQGLLWGYVHDPGAAMLGNVAGHAGLFSTANDLAVLYQMLLNGGHIGEEDYLERSTIDWFTSYQTPISRRGLGYDKPSKNNESLSVDKAYPAKYVSPATYGHTGYTGTCVWVDPDKDLIYIFLSNRVNPTGGTNTKISSLNIRSRIQDIIYKSIIR